MAATSPLRKRAHARNAVVAEAAGAAVTAEVEVEAVIAAAVAAVAEEIAIVVRANHATKIPFSHEAGRLRSASFYFYEYGAIHLNG